MSSIEKFINLLLEEDFKEAHEVLEADWLEFKRQGLKEKASFYKGLINGATSIALIRLNRSQRAKQITWEAFLKYKGFIDIIEKEKRPKYIEAINILESKRNEYL
jgi:hypothetical protein